jgi:hypothetical protein
MPPTTIPYNATPVDVSMTTFSQKQQNYDTWRPKEERRKAVGWVVSCRRIIDQPLWVLARCSVDLFLKQKLQIVRYFFDLRG